MAGLLSHLYTSLHKGHPGLRTTMITAPFSLHSSLAFTTLLLSSSRTNSVKPSLDRSYGLRLGLKERKQSLEMTQEITQESTYRYHGELATKIAAPKAVAAVPRIMPHIFTHTVSLLGLGHMYCAILLGKGQTRIT